MTSIRLLFGIFILLLSLAVWGQSDATQQNSSSTSAHNNPLTIRGCLTGSEGAYVLVAEPHGKPYLLEGNTSSLEKMIQHEIEVAGEVKNQTGSDHVPSSAAPEDRTQPPGATLEVSSVREISDTCAAKSTK